MSHPARESVYIPRMRLLLAGIVLAILAVDTVRPQAQQAATPVAMGVRLETQTWVDAQALLRPDTVVVIPLGAALMEHGPHLKLRNDLSLANYFTDRVVETSNVVVTPPLTYHFFPAFLEYPGSTSLTMDTARDMTAQVARTIARHGPRRFYVLNTGISTTRALQAAAQVLEKEGILLRYTDFGAAAAQGSARIREQEAGSHADEIETSLMLFVDPSAVDMKRAVRDISPVSTPFRLTRERGAAGIYSPTGTWGDPTLATPSKGKIIAEAIVNAMLRDIESLRGEAPPEPERTTPRPTSPPQPPWRPAPNIGSAVNGCPQGEDRDIKKLEALYNWAWMNRDAIALGGMWAEEGDIVHTDNSTERGRSRITQNRHEQFMGREFKAARHTLTFGHIRCLDARVAVVDSKWDLRDVTDAGGGALPRTEGFATLVLQRIGDGWAIQAYRYNTKPGTPPGPTLQKKPGYPDKQ